MCGSQKHFRVSGRTKRLYSLCMDSMARHETNTCDIWKTVRMISQTAWNLIDAYLIYFSFTAYLSRDFNVVLVDWKKLTYYPCYFSALGNTKLVAQCTAQVKIVGRHSWWDSLVSYKFHSQLFARRMKEKINKTELIGQKVIDITYKCLRLRQRVNHETTITNWIILHHKKQIQFTANDVTLPANNTMPMGAKCD